MVGVTIRQSSIYIPADNMVHIDNRLFKKDDIRSRDEMEFHPQEAGTSTNIEYELVEEHPSLRVFEAPSRTFRSIDWMAANISISSRLEARCTSWKRGIELSKELHFADKTKL